jgi:alanine racemase
MMNHVIIDVTKATTTNDLLVATLVGTDGSDSISIEQLADWAGTINYEIVTRIGAHLERRVCD